MDNAQLTRKQQQFFNYILDYREDNDVWPTYREIADRFGYKSPNSVTQNIKSLVKKGVLYKTSDDEYEVSPEHDPEYEDENTYGGIPIKGIITAGFLQEAVEANLGSIGLKTLFPNLEKMFALRVAGMSMRDTGIKDGDFVLLCDEDIKNGDIGAVLYNGETSLKRIYYDKHQLRLEPANEEYSTVTIEPDLFEEVKVIGKYIGHVDRQGIYKNTIKN
jgi:SOS regulatory protein LexA